MPTTLWRITKTEMERALQSQPEFSHRFLAYMLQRNIQIEEDVFLARRLTTHFPLPCRRAGRETLVFGYGPEASIEERAANTFD